MNDSRKLVLLAKLNRVEAEGKLLPRRLEILLTIRDHSPCSLDFLQRNFMGTPGSTLRYDLLKLQRAGLIQKLGVTRGALYCASPTE